jgi:hypothetical protein
MITIIDISSRSFVRNIIKRIGYKTISRELRDIMIIIFIVQFFNMAVLLILADVDFN